MGLLAARPASHGSRGAPRLIAPLCLLLILACATALPDLQADETTDLESEQAELREVINEGHYAHAESLALDLLYRTRSTYGDRSLEAAKVMDLLTESLRRQGRSFESETQDLARQTLDLKESLLDENDPEIAISAENLALILQDPDLARRAVRIRESAFGIDSPEAARSHVILGNILLGTDHMSEAKLQYEHALEIQQQVYGTNSEQTAYTVNNLAILHHELGEYDAARRRYEDALAIREQLSGPNSLNLAWTLNGLAGLFEELGEFEEAEATYLRCLTIRETGLGPDHLHVAWTLNNMGYLYWRMGDYASSLAAYERSLAITIENLGESNVDVAMGAGNLGELHETMGDYERAHELYERALGLWEAEIDADRTEIAQSLLRLGKLQVETGDSAQALPSLERSLEILAQNVGQDHPAYANVLQALGDAWVALGDETTARDYYARALLTRESALGSDHPDVAKSLLRLAELDLRTGSEDQGISLAADALSIAKAAVGLDSPLAADAQATLARGFAAKGMYEQALDSALAAEETASSHLRRTIRVLPERNALRYAATRTTGLDVALSIAELRQEPETTRRVWSAVLRSRSSVLDEMAARQRITMVTTNESVAALHSSVVAANRRLAHLFVQGAGSGSIESYRSELEAAMRSCEEAERELAAASTGLRFDMGASTTELSAVETMLPTRAALVAFAMYRPVSTPDSAAPDDTDQAGTQDPAVGETRYVALMLPSASAEPVIVPVGSRKQVDGEVERWSSSIQQILRRSTSLESAEQGYVRVAPSLRRLIWDPLLPGLSDADMALIVPTGSLHLVSFASLTTDSGAYLIESEPMIHYLSTERDLLVASPVDPECQRMLAVGGPSFDAELTPTIAHASPAIQELYAGTFAPRGMDCEALSDHWFEPLPASAEECRSVTRIWADAHHDLTTGVGENGSNETRVLMSLTGAEATELAFLNESPGACVLHLATHAFNLGAACASSGTSMRGFAGTVVLEETQPHRDPLVNPLLLTGLAFAGANHRSESPDATGDGILTAAEVLSVDLSSTRWAVLSACATGTGELTDGEGVLGLKRAFQIAGARTIVLSLWPVEDDATRDLMTALYEARFQQMMNTAEAMRHASLTVLNDRRKRSQSTHPLFWAGFVATGDWR